MKPIILYDIPTTHVPETIFSSPWKTRYSLNFKGIPFETVLVEMPDIESLGKKLGVKQNDTIFGRIYSTPIIYDPNTGTAHTESALIAEYLDATYPETPQLFPQGTKALQHAFNDSFVPHLFAVWQYLIPALHGVLNPASQDYFRRTREKVFGGKKLEDITPTGDVNREEWDKLKAGFDVINAWWEKAEGPFLLGEKPAFVDFAVAALLQNMKQVFGIRSSQWKDISSWNGGRWGELVTRLQEYE